MIPTSERGHWLVVLAEAEGLRWVLNNSRMAWTEASSGRAAEVKPGDKMILYVARGAFHNPSRDHSQLIGLAEVITPVGWFRRPLEIAGRRFVSGCQLRLETVLPQREGVDVRPLVHRMSFVRRKDAWGQYFRSGLVRLPPRDFQVLASAVRRTASGNTSASSDRTSRVRARS